MTKSEVRSIASIARHNARRWLPIIVVAMPVLTYGGFVVGSLDKSPMLSSDYAVMEMWTRSASHGEALLGPYSRYGWNHPGPSLFYWYAPFYRLSGQVPGGIGFATLLVALSSLVAIVALAGRKRGQAVRWTIAGVLIGMLVATGTDWFDEPWNPVVVVLPIVVAGVAAADVASGRRWSLPIATFAVTFCVQTHIGTLPVVAAFALVAAVTSVLQARRSLAAWTKPFAASVVVALTLWVLPLFEQATAKPGNFTQIWDYNVEQSGTHHSFGAVLDVTATFLTLSQRGLVGSVLGRGEAVPGLGLGRGLLLVALLVGAVVGGLRSLRCGRQFEAAVCLGSVLAAGVLVGALTRADGPLFPYLALSAISVGVLLYMGIALAVLAELRDRQLVARLRLVVPIMVVLGSVVLAAGVVTGSDRHQVFGPSGSRPGSTERLPDAEGAVATVVRALPPGSTTVRVEIRSSQFWSVAALVANQLEVEGYPTTTTDNWTYMFGEQRASNGCESSVVRVGPVSTSPSEATPDATTGLIFNGTPTSIEVFTATVPERCR